MTIQRLQQELLCDKKWRLFTKRTWLFRHIPFIECAFGSGSLAVGNVDAESDFDLLIGVRSGRIFTGRFFAALFFGIRGWRRAKEHHQGSAANKICLNHFVTPATYRLSLTPNTYWQLLYAGLVPVYGEPRVIQAFYDANADWMEKQRVLEGDLRFVHQPKSWLKNTLELLLDGAFGNWVEAKLRRYQIARIERGLTEEKESRPAHQMRVTGVSRPEHIELPPLIVYTDQELEFHPDPASIELTP
jgi:hypothetical protein